jgi:hypothetical protein
MTNRLFWNAVGVAALFALVVGCTGKPKKVWVEDPNPPVFGSTEATKTWPGFLEGKWGVKTMINMEHAKNDLKLGGVADQIANEEITDTITFKADGTFKMHIKMVGWVPAGTYAGNANSLSLTFTTIDGKPIQEMDAKVKKDEEGGTQGAIATALGYEGMRASINRMSSYVLSADGKYLHFPVQEGAIMIGTVDNGLVRMAEEKPEK